MPVQNYFCKTPKTLKHIAFYVSGNLLTKTKNPARSAPGWSTQAEYFPTNFNRFPTFVKGFIYKFNFHSDSTGRNRIDGLCPY